MLRRSKYHKTSEEISAEDRQVKAAQRDRRKFDVLYRKYYEPIYMYIFQRVESEDIAADVTSQVFVKAMLHLPRYEFRGLPFSSWLYRIAKNELNLWFRTLKARRVVSAETTHLQAINEEIEDDYPETEVQEMLEAIRHLRMADIELIEMRFFEKRPFKEIAEILEITENNAKVRTYRALDKLKKVMERTKEGIHG